MKRYRLARVIGSLAAGAMVLGMIPASRATAARAGAVAVMTGGRFAYTGQPGDSLWLVGARLGVDALTLAALNQIDLNARLRVGQTILIDNRHLIPDRHQTAIVINIPQRLLFHTDTDGEVSAYPVGLGRPTWPTFVGTFQIASLETDPVWDVPRSIQEELRRSGKPVVTHVAPGPNNPLGAFWIGLDRPGYGIHGTNAPASIYHFQTHGCIRLHPDDVALLFRAVAVGTTGEIVYQPILLARSDDGTIWLEAHPDVYRRSPDALATVRELAGQEEFEADMDWQIVRSVLRARQGAPIDVTLRGAESHLERRR
ncbi:MAG TPA: L,D-transpeptidase family protein [Vicinamibacterales bacterium]|nr:L,D-transpeptidase family protein [Vicinamibacterales bacterium]